jgi:sugar-specific transcriptional regulator TrmB
MQTLNDILKRLGLSSSEIDVYLSILDAGIIGPTAISKETGINRATIYAIAKRLIEKGLITEQGYKSGIRYKVSSSKEIVTSMKRERSKIDEQMELVNVLEEAIDLHKKANGSLSIPQYQLIESKDIMSHLKKRSKVWNDSALSYDATWWGFQNATFVKKYADWLESFWIEADPRIQVKLISSQKFDDNLSTKLRERRMVKVLDDEMYDATTWVIGDYVVQITNPEEPYLIEVKHPSLAANHRAVFKALWGRI